jgi:hypothetical protein
MSAHRFKTERESADEANAAFLREWARGPFAEHIEAKARRRLYAVAELIAVGSYREAADRVEDLDDYVPERTYQYLRSKGVVP